MGAGIINNVDFNHIKIREYNGRQFDITLNTYNEITRDLCKSQDLKCIDLWERLQKDPAYFYDEIHFSKAGCKKVGEIVGNELSLYFKED